MNKQTDPAELAKGIPFIVVDLLDYVPNAVVRKTILQKTTGAITVSSLDAGEKLVEKTLPFDLFVQIVDGTAGIIINEKDYRLVAGQCMVVPAHAKHRFQANEQFKMIATLIKSGYED